MSDLTWEVAVSKNGETILTIGSNHLSGVENINDYADIVRSCADHLRSFIGEVPWQPIETAPKDGTRFLGCTHNGNTQIIKRNKHLHIWILDDGKESWREMTYWMPIPNSPTPA